MSKCISHIRAICFGILFCVQTASWAQNQIKTDSSQVEVKRFEENLQERYTDDAFNYDINDTGGVNLIQGLFRRLFRWLGDIFGIDIDFVDYRTLEIIVYSLLGLGALYLFINFMMQSPVSSVFKTEEQTIDGFNYVEENITEIDFDSLITSALKEHNYRLATRYLYLKSLKLLSKKGIIDWHYDKTNSDYIHEISNNHTKQNFRRVSYIYDYVWYGEFDIDAEQFQRNQKDFNNLNHSVNG